MAQRVGRGIALLFHDHGTRRGWMVSSTPRPYFTPGKDPVPIVQEAGSVMCFSKITIIIMMMMMMMMMMIIIIIIITIILIIIVY